MLKPQHVQTARLETIQHIQNVVYYLSVDASWALHIVYKCLKSKLEGDAESTAKWNRRYVSCPCVWPSPCKATHLYRTGPVYKCSAYKHRAHLTSSFSDCCSMRWKGCRNCKWPEIYVRSTLRLHQLACSPHGPGRHWEGKKSASTRISL